MATSHPTFGLWNGEIALVFREYTLASLEQPLLLEGEAGVVSAHTVAGEASALLHVMARDTQDLELCLERIRATDGISRTVTEVVLSTLFER